MAHGILQADVCIICALEEEAHAVEQVISEHCKVTFVANVIPESRFAYRSTIITNSSGEQLTLALLCQSHPDPISAAFNLGALLEKFQPCFVAMSGICASDKRHLQLGDLAVAEHAYHFEEGKVTRDEQGGVLYQPGGIPYGPTEQVLRYVRTFAGWSTPVAELKKQLLGSDEPPQRVLTLMASGMAVRCDDPFESLQRQQRKTWALDMEAASFYLALRADPFVHGLVVKGVVDHADRSKDDTFHDFAARASALYLLTFIQEYVTTNALLHRRSPAVYKLSGEETEEQHSSHFGPKSQVRSEGCLESVGLSQVKTDRFWQGRKQPHPSQIHATPATRRMAHTKKAEPMDGILIPKWLLLVVAPPLALALILLLVIVVFIPRTSNPVVASRSTATPVVTSTAMPTATPTIAPNSPAGPLAQATAGPPTFSDSLAQSDTNWDTNQNCSFTQGAYQATKGDSSANTFVPCPERAIQFSPNLAYQVQMTIIQGDTGGIFFRDDQSEHFDALFVNANGNYIFEGNVQQGGSLSDTVFKKGLNQTNQFTVIARDNEVYVYVNNQFVFNSFSNQRANGSYIGVLVLAVNNPTTVQYKNVQVWALP